ncbi:MAG: hypothetical protein R2911_03140 [Caldilineaceae bacterium]
MSQDESALIQLAVNGTLMRGLALNQNLTNVGATFVREAETDAYYRLWSINDVHPAMLRDLAGGNHIQLEIWALSPQALTTVLQQEPPGLCIGRLKLSDGSEVLGVLGEPFLCQGQTEITHFGGWRAYTLAVGIDEKDAA